MMPLRTRVVAPRFHDRQMSGVWMRAYLAATAEEREAVGA